MVKLYILPVKRKGNTDIVSGIEYIHHAVLRYGASQAEVIQDTTELEHAELSKLAIKVLETKIELPNFPF